MTPFGSEQPFTLDPTVVYTSSRYPASANVGAYAIRWRLNLRGTRITDDAMFTHRALSTPIVKAVCIVGSYSRVQNG